MLNLEHFKITLKVKWLKQIVAGKGGWTTIPIGYGTAEQEIIAMCIFSELHRLGFQRGFNLSNGPSERTTNDATLKLACRYIYIYISKGGWMDRQIDRRDVNNHSVERSVRPAWFLCGQFQHRWPTPFQSMRRVKILQMFMSVL